MRTDAPFAIVFEPVHAPASAASAAPGVAAPGWLASRTSRWLSKRAIPHVVSHGVEHLVETLLAAPGPSWVLRAGAVPLEVPRVPPPSATGRSLLALGATQEDRAWALRLAQTGGDALGTGMDLPPVRSVLVERPIELATELVDDGAADPVSSACTSLAQRSRAVRIPSFDVAFTTAIHVVELVTTLHRGGAEQVVLELVRELDVCGVDATLAVLDGASRTTFAAPPGTVFLDRLAATRAQRLEALGALAVAVGADVVHAHLLNGDDLRTLARSGVPLVTTFHNSEPGWPARLDALAPGDIALAIACSLEVERQLIASRLPFAVRTIWNGIVSGTPRPRAAMQREDKIRMLTVANHRPQKRLERLPSVVADLRARGRDASLLIVGEPIKADPIMTGIAGRIRDEAARLGVSDSVSIAGSTGDVGALYASHDVVVSASAFEGLSLVHLESLAAGLPLITTEVAGTEELSRKHGHVHRVGIDAAPGAFGDAVLSALESADAAPSSPRRLALDFGASKMAERHADLFARVLADPCARGASRGRGARAPRGGLVLVANNFSTGGAQSSARRLLQALAAAGIRVRAVVLQEQAAFPTPGRVALAKAGIEVLVAPRAGEVDPLVTARAIASAVDEWAPDALVFWNVIAQHKVLIADLLLDTPVWDVSPGEMYFSSFERYFAKPRVASPYLSMRDYGVRLAGAIVKYETERTRAEEALGVTTFVVPNGVIVPRLPPAPPAGDRAGGPRVVIGTLARLSVDKKLEQLVDAFAHVARFGLLDSCELRIAGGTEPGDEAYVAELRERSRDLRIAWVGEQDATSFLRELDLFAMVSEPSGCPNASLEAMAAGLPVVATDVGGAREQIVHGQTGLLVPRGDAVALGEALGLLAGDSARRVAMGRAAHARALAQFDVHRMAREYARICLGDAAASLVDAAAEV